MHNQPQVIVEDDETLDDLLIGGLKIIQPRKGYRFSIDSVLLAQFPILNGQEKVIDLGTGNGIIPLLMSARSPSIHITGIEMQAAMVERARKSIALNRLSNIDIRQEDIRDTKQIFPPRTFDLVMSNPPFWRKGEGKVNTNREESIARHEVEISLREVVEAAAYLLVPGGNFCLIHRASRLPEIFQLCIDQGITPDRVRTVHAFADREATQVLFAGKKNTKTSLSVLPPLILYSRPGEYFREIQELYSLN